LSSHSTHVTVDLTDHDDAVAQEMVEATRQVVESSTAPPPLEDDVRCSSCSHIRYACPTSDSWRKCSDRCGWPTRTAR